MPDQRVVVLDGTAASNEGQAHIAAVLQEILAASSDEVRTFVLRDERIMHCIGCFGCWLETPGLCRAADRGRDIVRAMVHADTVVLLTPVTFGGYSSALKRLVDRWVQMLLPFFQKVGGELHHPLRYGRFPRLVAVGIQPTPDDAEAALFRVLVGRNAINFRAASHAVDFVGERDDEAGLREKLTALVTRADADPTVADLAALVPEPAPSVPASGGRQALVLVGSPKTKQPSTSSVLGRHLLDGLAARGWQGDLLTVTAAIREESWRNRMLAAVDEADLIVLASPLYVDALPALLTRALEVIREHRAGRPAPRKQRLAAIVNCGFPEAHQDLPAVAICARFAAAAGMAWAGYLAVGAGEALSSGMPLTGRAKGMGRPPVGHVVAALDLAAEELAGGRPIPPNAGTLIARTPIPHVPFVVWRGLFAFMGTRRWRAEAAGHGVTRAALLARPFLV